VGWGNRGAIDFERLVHPKIANHQPERDAEVGREAFRQAIENVMGAVRTPVGRSSSFNSCTTDALSFGVIVYLMIDRNEPLPDRRDHRCVERHSRTLGQAS
jgi:hypothetical protein